MFSDRRSSATRPRRGREQFSGGSADAGDTRGDAAAGSGVYAAEGRGSTGSAGTLEDLSARSGATLFERAEFGADLDDKADIAACMREAVLGRGREAELSLWSTSSREAAAGGVDMDRRPALVDAGVE